MIASNTSFWKVWALHQTQDDALTFEGADSTSIYQVAEWWALKTQLQEDTFVFVWEQREDDPHVCVVKVKRSITYDAEELDK